VIGFIIILNGILIFLNITNDILVNRTAGCW
jgi:hypothetical protein